MEERSYGVRGEKDQSVGCSRPAKGIEKEKRTNVSRRRAMEEEECWWWWVASRRSGQSRRGGGESANVHSFVSRPIRACPDLFRAKTEEAKASISPHALYIYIRLKVDQPLPSL